MSYGFRVLVSRLTATAGRLEGHEIDLQRAGRASADAAAGVGGASGDGPLAGALSRFAPTLASRTDEFGKALAQAGDALRDSAVYYAKADDGVQSTFTGGHEVGGS